MKPQPYTTETRDQRGTTAVIRIGAKGGRKTVSVYSNPFDAERVVQALNASRREEL